MATAEEAILEQDLDASEDYGACEHLTAEEEELLLADDGTDGVDIKPSFGRDVKPSVAELPSVESAVNGSSRLGNGGASTAGVPENTPAKSEAPAVSRSDGFVPNESSLMGPYRGGRPRGGGFGPPFGRGGLFPPRFRPPFGPGPRFRGLPPPHFRGPMSPFDLLDDFDGPDFDDFLGGPGPGRGRGGFMGPRSRGPPPHMGDDFRGGPPFRRMDRFPGPPGRGGYGSRGPPPGRSGDEPPIPRPSPAAPMIAPSASVPSTTTPSGASGDGSKDEVRKAREAALSALAKLRASGDIDPLPVPPDRRAPGIDFLEEPPRKGPPPPQRGGGPMRSRAPLGPPRVGGMRSFSPPPDFPLPPLPPRGMRPPPRFDRSMSPPMLRRPPMDDIFMRRRPLSPPPLPRRPPTPPVHRYEPVLVERERPAIPIVRYEDELQVHAPPPHPHPPPPPPPPSRPAPPTHHTSHYDHHADYYSSTVPDTHVERDPYATTSYYAPPPPPPPPPPPVPKMSHYAPHTSSHPYDDDPYRRPRDDYRSAPPAPAPAPTAPPPPPAAAPRSNPNLITLAGGDDETSEQKSLKRLADGSAGGPMAKRPYGGPGGPGPLGRTRRIRIENFPPSMNRKLRSMCEHHGGDIERFDMMKTSTGRLVALVQFRIQDSADRFLKTYHKRQIEACVLSVNYVPVVSPE